MNKFFAAALGALALVAGLSVATTETFAARNYNTPLTELSLKPWAVSGLCKNNPVECRGGGSASITATPDLIKLLKRVNAQVNRSIRFRPERIDDWAINPREGDCEDFALSKRSALVRAGVDASALRIGITSTRSGEAHAVLLVMTDVGRLVLDNRTGVIREVGRSEYRIQAMSGRSLNEWGRG